MIFVLIMMLALGMVVFWIPGTGWIVVVAMLAPVITFVAIYAALAKWIVNRIYAKHRFRITDEELIIETGLITTNRVLIPLIGVQQVNVIETFWGRRYGLKNVVVNTAGRMYIPNSTHIWGSGVLMGLKNADDVAEALLSRVKDVKASTNVGI
jgi:membrane protein YdbS with pleckstrin-like domain